MKDLELVKKGYANGQAIGAPFTEENKVKMIDIANLLFISSVINCSKDIEKFYFWLFIMRQL